MQGDHKMINAKRSISFWVVMVFLAISMVLLIMGQAMALFNYDFAVSLGLQEDVREVGEYGVQLNRAFGAGDTFIYIPLIALSIAGLVMKKRWALITTAAVMGISAYWATTVAFLLWFLVGVPGYSFMPGPEYWVIISAYIVFGVWGVVYLMFHGDKIIN